LAETKGNDLTKINRECKIMANKACNEVVTVAKMPMTVFDMISAMQNKYADRVAFRYVEGKDTVVEKTYAQYVQDIRKVTRGDSSGLAADREHHTNA